MTMIKSQKLSYTMEKTDKVVRLDKNFFYTKIYKSQSSRKTEFLTIGITPKPQKIHPPLTIKNLL